MSKDDFVVEMLALQFISGKTVDSAAEYVELYRKAKSEIAIAYKQTDTVNFGEDFENLL